MPRFSRVLSLVLLAGSVMVALYAYMTLPAIVTTHLDGAFRPDGRGPKWTVFLVPILQVFWIVFFQAISRIPSECNPWYYPTQPEKTAAMKVRTQRIVGWSNLLLSSLCFVGEILIVSTSRLPLTK